MKRLVIAGGRDFDDYEFLKGAVGQVLGVGPVDGLEIVSGMARGADTLGERWASEHGVPVRQFPADWRNEGKAAGYRRNERMADYADTVVLMPGGKGTQHMADIAARKGLQVFDFRTGDQVVLSRGLPKYEVSTLGDRRFSALNARLSDGRVVEQAWAEAKGYPTMKAAKGQTALVPDFDYWGTYKGLWGQWAAENPQLMDELAEVYKTHDLVDSYAKTENNQARALMALLAERASTPAPERRGAFVIVPSRVTNPDYQHLGMREKGFNMATAPAPYAPGWLGNPMVANDAGGRVSREEATRYFRGVIEEKAQDPAWRDAFLSLDENTRVGYYKPEEEFIHLHELQKWILENRVSPEPAVAAAGGGGGGAPPVVQLELPLAGPGGPEPASPMRMAGQAWPWIAAAAGGLAALGGGVVLLSSDEEEQAPPPMVM